MGKRKKADEVSNAVDAGTTASPAKRVDEFAALGVPPGWKPAAQSLEYTTAVRTCFFDFNRGTRVGGLPTGRIVVVSGETHSGKTVVQLALAKSYLDAGHVVFYVDAEHALDRKLVEVILGAKLEDVPNLYYELPDTYEDTIDKVTGALRWMREVLKQHPEKRCLILVDSLNMLTPKKEMEALQAAASKLAKESTGEGGEEADSKKARGGRPRTEKGGDSVMKGWGRLRAAFNQVFLDMLAPKLAKSGATAVLVVQERDDASGEQGLWDMMNLYQLKGGKAVKYYASLLLRVTKEEAVRAKPGDKKSAVVAWRHQIRIWKSRVGRMDDRWTDCDFYLRQDSSIDVARDALHVGAALGVVQVAGNWYTWDRVRAPGVSAMVRKLDAEPERLAKLLREVAEAVDAERESGKGADDEAAGDV